MEKSQRSLFGDEHAPWEQDAADEGWVAQVVFAEAPYGPFDYRVPDRFRETLKLGMRVRVPLGRGNRTMVGYCTALFDPREGAPAPHSLLDANAPNAADPRHAAARSAKPYPYARLKPVSAILDEASLLPADLLQVAWWIAEYYLSPLGQVIEAMVPAAVREQAGTREQAFLTVPNHVLARLTQLRLPAKQSQVVTYLAGAGQPMTVNELASAIGCTSAPINALRKKGLLTETTARVSTHEGFAEHDAQGRAWTLNDDQQLALATILASLKQSRAETLLLHGITGSGKTEVYIQAIEEVISYGRQAIVLVPEISLTPQTRQRFRERFQRVAVLHSHLSASERHHQWKRIAAGDIQVIVGARSAIFAPAPRLGLIVLDEEHDASFKQDKNPRYHAREVALYRARQLGIPVVLGSATPSLESWQAARDGRFRRLALPARVMNRPLPDVRVVDLRIEFRQRKWKGLVSRPLYGAIRETLNDGGQVILLLNRRGFARHIQCPACGATVECPECDIALTHHQDGQVAICHYCEYRRPTPRTCPACDFEGIRYAGHGTQKLEDEVASRFPEARVLRMDSDSMQRHGSHEAALDQFRNHEIDILVGTQMIAKGLDFPNVTLVGVVNADTSLHFPDFRAAERTFALVTQVAGRSGRGEKGGRVLVQTLSPEHPAIEAARRHDYELFANTELSGREAFGYPPFAQLARFVFRGESDERTREFAIAAMSYVQERIDQEFGIAKGKQGDLFTPEPTEFSEADETSPIRILGPVEATIAKIRNRFRFHALVQSTAKTPLQPLLREAMNLFPKDKEVEWIVDIDPLDML